MATERYLILREKMVAEYPRTRVIKKKDCWWIRAIFAVLSFVTRKDYSNFATTIGSTIIVPNNWDDRTVYAKYKLLRHEKKHVEQFHRWPLGAWAWPLNHFLCGLCYLLLLPVLWTFRARFEREAYLQTLLVEFEFNGKICEERMRENARWMGETFGGSAYFFMWTKNRAYNWAMKMQAIINEGKIKNDKDRVD
jgi:hypothetical protein